MGIRSIFRKAVALGFLASVADCSMTSGKHGGNILDNAGQHEAANVYRAGGRVVNGVTGFMLWGVKQMGRDIMEFSDKHGRPQP